MFDAQVYNKYVVAPGSLHPSGIRYQIIDDSQIVPAPDWLMNWIAAQAKRSNFRWTGVGCSWSLISPELLATGDANLVEVPLD